jgi:hypothetical protein
LANAIDARTIDEFAEGVRVVAGIVAGAPSTKSAGKHYWR